MLKQIRRVDKSLILEFQDASQNVELPTAWLRSHCSCAMCLKAKMDEIPLFSSRAAMESFYQIKKIERVGNYAIGVFWGDGHHSIYALDRLIESFRNLELPPHLKSIKTEVQAL